MSLQIATTQDVSLEELRIEPTFLSNLESSIAVGLGVLVDQVMVTKVEVDSRRLQADPEGVPARHLQSTALKVDYEVYMNGDAEKSRIKSHMEASMNSEGEFAKAFQKELQANEKASGRTVVVDSITVASVDVVERSDSISDAKETAKRKAVPTTTAPPAPAPTTSTTKKPATVVTEAPTTTQEASLDTQAAGGTSRIFPHVCLVSVGILAAW